MDPLQILPEDCWEPILSKLSVDDVERCANVCTLFQTILHRLKGEPSWAFHRASAVMFDHLFATKNSTRWISPIKDLLAYRLVCKGWYRSVDCFLATTLPADSQVSGDHPYAHTFKNGTEIASFLASFGTGNVKNQLFGKHLILDSRISEMGIDPDDDEENVIIQQDFYTEQILELVSIYGSSVLSVSIGEVNPLFQLSYAVNVRNIIQHCPNLSSLIIKWQCMFSIENAADELENYNLPDRPNLHQMNLLTDKNQFARCLLRRYGNQLKRLEVLSPLHLDGVTDCFTGLDKLEIADVGPDDSLQIFRTMLAQLKTLNINISQQEGYVPLSRIWAVDKFLRNIAHLSIHELSIAWDSQFIGEHELIPTDFKITSIKTVRILCRSPSMTVSFNFLCHLPNLQEVSIDWSLKPTLAEHPGGIPEKLDLKTCVLAGNVYECNLWERIPSLMQLSVAKGTEIHVYCREEYDQRHSAKRLQLM